MPVRVKFCGRELCTLIGDGYNFMPLMYDNTVPGFQKITDGNTELDIVDEGDNIAIDDEGLIVYGKKRTTDTALPLEFDDLNNLYVNMTASGGAGLVLGDVRVTDLAEILDVVPVGAVIDTGIVAMGEDLSNNTTQALPLHNHGFASANYDVHYPMGGVSYPPAGNHAAYMIKVDSGGSQWCRITDGTDTLDVCPNGVVPSNGIQMMALNTSPAPSVTQEFVVHAEGVQTSRDFSVPVGGTNYAAPDSAYTIKVSAGGKQYIDVVDSIAGEVDVDVNTWSLGAMTDLGRIKVWDTTDTLGIVPAGQAVAPGITVYGEDGLTGNVKPLPIETDGVATDNEFLPVGGRDYTHVNLLGHYAFIDDEGRFSVRSQTTDRDGVQLITSGEGSRRSLHTSEVKPEIWGDEYLLWEDRMETLSGGGLTTCKWVGPTNWPPFNCNTGSTKYVEGDLIGPAPGAPYFIPPFEGNWMLKLYKESEEANALVESDCITKLGEIDQKKLSIELRFSGRKTSVDMTNSVPFAFGFYQYSPNAAGDAFNRRMFLARLRVPPAGLPEWQFYNSAGVWQVIDEDARQVRSVSPFWPANDYFCWHYAKLTVNVNAPAGHGYMIDSLTVDDTTWQLHEHAFEDVLPGPPPTPMSGLCPYLYMQAPAFEGAVEIGYIGAMLVDKVQVWANELEDDNALAADYGQKVEMGS